jgi:hypothetical protein
MVTNMYELGLGFHRFQDGMALEETHGNSDLYLYLIL